LQPIRPLPITRDLVLLGGGHAHALVLHQWAMNPLPGAQVTLVNPQAKAPYTGMLPGFVAGHYSRRDLDIDLVRLARQAGARLIIDRAVGIDTSCKRVHLAERPDIPYDTLSVDIGITSALRDLPGADAHLVPAKPLGAFADAWSELVQRAIDGELRPEIAILGAGVAGVELALAMAHRLETAGQSGQIRLIESGPSILREVNGSARRKLITELARAKVEIHTDANVQDVSIDGVMVGIDGQLIPANFIVSAAGAAPHAWLAETGLTLERGYISVQETLQSINTPNVFAAGDCAHLKHAPRPKAGVFAVRQAPILFENLRADLSGDGSFKKYAPQRSYLKLISTGRKSAITDKWGIGISGKTVWALKDRIDQAFMDKFRGHMEMPVPVLPSSRADGLDELLDAHTHQCGACGAKVAQETLMDGLAPELGSSLDDAAILRSKGRVRVLSTDHLRAFNADAYLLAKVAAIHALGDIWAMGATPNAVLSHIILPPLAPQKQADMIREIMAGASDVFEASGTTISGGHTSSGAELTIGFSIEGEATGDPITQSGAQPGDLIVLTKPIGTGVLLAAEMQQRADGDDYLAAIESMSRPQDMASKLLGGYATAMTDVTGFGLAGHVLNILTASSASAEIELDKIPLLNGAEELSAAGIRSTLWPANAQQIARMTVNTSARADLLFDPQTCGGMLATVSPTHLDKTLAEFENAGEPIWQIGTIGDGVPHLHII